MLLAIADTFRCTASHADTWLVARADRADRGFMIDGVLGCPICFDERVVRGGVLHWSDLAAPAPTTSAFDPMRVAALLNVGPGAKPFVLHGALAAAAPGISGLTDAPLVLCDAPDDSLAGLATIVRGAPFPPFAPSSLRGIAVDAGWATAAALDAAVRALAIGGRLVAPVSSALPFGVTELARDDQQWVAERAAGASAPVPLTRR